MEIVIGALVAVIGLCYVAELFVAPVDWRAAALGSVTPKLPDAQALTIAVGVIGATVMPHAIYLHSALMQARPAPRDDGERTLLVRYSHREVLVALVGAGLVNMAMVAMAAAAFHAGHSDVAEIETAYKTLTPLLGAGAAVLFLVSLLASGVAAPWSARWPGRSSCRASCDSRFPIWLRRLVTMVPAFVVVSLGVNATNALVLSQVVLSLALPLPMIALTLFTFRRDIMGRFANGFVLHCAAISATVVIVALNVLLLLQTFGAPIPLGAF